MKRCILFSKIFVVLLISSSAFLITTVCQNTKASDDIVNSRHYSNQKCIENPDALYNRQKILENLAKTLDSSAPEYKKFFNQGFFVKNERGGGFFIYDLTDTSNKEISSSDCINFINNHVYHFAPVQMMFSFSHMLILEDGNLKIFKSINCNTKGDTLEDVIEYLSQKLKNDKDKGVIIDRVKKYREFGIYSTVDDTKIRCEEIKNDLKQE
jgi:hypothetical protein